MRLLLVLAVIAGCVRLCITDIVDPTSFRQEIHWSGLDGTVAISFAKDGKVLLTEKSGRIRLYDSIEADQNDYVYVLDETYSRTYTWWDKGMLGTAVHPEFPDTPLLWVLYSVNRLPKSDVDLNIFPKTECPVRFDDYCGTAARLARVRIDLVAKTSRVEQVLISDWCGASGSHHVGELVWASDGGMYASAGDGSAFEFTDTGVETDSCFNSDDSRLQGSFRAQHDNYLQGKIIHISEESLNADRELTLAGGDIRVVAKGFRNPYRFSVHPVTGDIYVGDVGSDFFEEINLVPNPLEPDNENAIPNFGWPCFEGTQAQPTFSPGNFEICTAMAEANTWSRPFFSYDRTNTLPSSDPVSSHCDAVNASPTGILFYTGEYFAEKFRGLMFWLDGSKRCVFYFDNDEDGSPDPTKLNTLLWTPETMNEQTRQKAKAGQWVDIKMAPSGIVYVVDFFDSNVHKVLAQGAETDPYAVIDIEQTRSPIAPFQTIVDGSRSYDIDEGDEITLFEWDFDGDGQFDDLKGDRAHAEKSQVTFQYGVHNVMLRVTDKSGRVKTKSVMVSAGVGIDFDVKFSPPSNEWTVQDTIEWKASVVADDGKIVAPADLSWRVVVYHCYESPCGGRVDCHLHEVSLEDASRTGSNGRFRPFAHPMPNFWNVTVTAQHPSFPGFFASKQLTTHPMYHQLTMETKPLGLPLDLCAKTPCFEHVMDGSTQEVFAQTIIAQNGNLYSFSFWDVEGKPTDATYKFRPTGDTVLVAIFQETQFARSNFSDLEAPTDLAVVEGFQELGVSWTGSAPQWYLIFYENNDIGEQFDVVYGTSTSAQVKQIPVAASTYSLSVAAMDAELRLSGRTPAQQVTSLAKPPEGYAGKCVSCFDEDELIADFDDSHEFGYGLNKLGRIFGTDDTMSVATREQKFDEWMMRLLPRQNNAYVYFILRPNVGCYDFTPWGLRWTSIQLDVVLTRTDASFMLRLRGNRENCEGTDIDLAVFDIGEYIDRSRVGNKQTVTVPLTDRRLDSGINVIMLNSFTALNTDYFIDNVKLHRDCAIHNASPPLDINECTLRVDDFESPERFALDQNLVPGPIPSSKYGSTNSLNMQRITRSSQGSLVLEPHVGAVYRTDLSHPGFCFNLHENDFQFVQFELTGEMGSSFNVRLVTKSDNCVSRDDNTMYVTPVNNWGGFSSRDASKTILVTIPMSAFRASSTQNVQGFELLHFAPARRTFTINNIALLQRCALPFVTSTPTWCSLQVDNFTDSTLWATSVNKLGGHNNFSRVSSTTRDIINGGVMLDIQSSDSKAVVFDVYDEGRKMCVDLSLYDSLSIIMKNSSANGDMEVRLTSRPSNCGGDSNEIVGSAVDSSAYTRVDDEGLVRVEIPLTQFTSIPLTNVHSIELNELEVGKTMLVSLSFERSDCAQYYPDVTAASSCETLVIEDFDNRGVAETTNSLGFVHNDDSSMIDVEYRSQGNMQLKPKSSGSYWYSVIGQCRDISRFTHLHLAVTTGAGFDMNVFLQSSDECGDDNIDQEDIDLGTIADYAEKEFDNTSQDVWIPLHHIDSKILSRIHAIGVNNLFVTETTNTIIIDNIFLGDHCVPVILKSKSYVLLFVILSCIAFAVLVFLVSRRRQRNNKEVPNITTPLSSIEAMKNSEFDTENQSVSYARMSPSSYKRQQNSLDNHNGNAMNASQQSWQWPKSYTPK